MADQLNTDNEILKLGEQLKQLKTINDRINDIQKITELYNAKCEKTTSDIAAKLDEFKSAVERNNIASLIEALQRAQNNLSDIGRRFSNIETKSETINSNTTETRAEISSLSGTVAVGNVEIKSKIDGTHTTNSQELQIIKRDLQSTIKTVQRLSKQQADDTIAIKEYLRHTSKTMKIMFALCSVLVVVIILAVLSI